jgi:hypothetical protein
MHYFARRRTLKANSRGQMQGVEAPSQKRYVEYIHQLQISPGLDYISAPAITITKIIIRTLPNQKLSAMNTSLVIENGHASRMKTIVYDHCVRVAGMERLIKSQTPSEDFWELNVGNVMVTGDVTIRLFHFPDEIDTKGQHGWDVRSPRVLDSAESITI